MTDFKWPRQYAAEIVALRTPEERSQALAACPALFRPMVRIHVESTFMVRRARR